MRRLLAALKYFFFPNQFLKLDKKLALTAPVLVSIRSQGSEDHLLSLLTETADQIWHFETPVAPRQPALF